jgi:hypothetical protein
MAVHTFDRLTNSNSRQYRHCMSMTGVRELLSGSPSASNPQLVISIITEDFDLRLGVWLTAAAVALAIPKASAKTKRLVMDAASASRSWAASAEVGRASSAKRALDDVHRVYDEIANVAEMSRGDSAKDIDILMSAGNVVEMAISAHELMYSPSRRKSLQQLVREARQANDEYESPMDLAYRSVNHLIDAGISKRSIVDAMLVALEEYPHRL